jgi:hypothetical protein
MSAFATAALLTSLSLGGCSSSDTGKADAAGGRGGTGGGGSGGTSGTGGTSNDGSADAVCSTAGPLTPPAVQAAIQPPAGATLVVRTHAVGTQNYVCKAVAAPDAGPVGAEVDAGAGVNYVWTFTGPMATLTDNSCKEVGTHGVGPTWTWTADGSTIKGTLVRPMDAPNKASDIPWLLLSAVSTGAGVFSGVTYVQRVDTSGGVAPTTGCDAANVDKTQAVGYSANYYFYKGGSAGDGGTSDGASPDGGGSTDSATADAPTD